MIWVSHQETMLVGKRRLRFFNANLVISVVVSVLFQIPLEAQFCHCKEVYRGCGLKASWSRLTPPRTASGPTVAVHVQQNPQPGNDAVAHVVSRRMPSSLTASD